MAYTPSPLKLCSIHASKKLSFSKESTVHKDLFELIENLSTDELVELNLQIVARLRHLTEKENKAAVANFSVGDEVQFKTQRGQWIRGRVCQINRKTIDVECESRSWRVPPRLLQKVNNKPDSKKESILLQSSQRG